MTEARDDDVGGLNKDNRLQIGNNSVITILPSVALSVLEKYAKFGMIF